jgi:dTDP-4-amino-4,6-dideoxygalactose transaminase
MQRRRLEIVRAYASAFAGLEQLALPSVRPHVESAWHLYVIQLNLESIRIDRAQFIDELRQRNIGTSVHFIPIYRHSYYRERYGLTPTDYPVADAAYNRIVSLPLSPAMTQGDVEDVIDAVRTVLTKHRR